MRHLSLIFLVLFFLSYTSTRLIAHESDAPFLYYYSQADNAIVIERADGTNRHLLAQNVSQDRIIYGLEWSPSGKWLLWNSARDDPPELIDTGTEQVWLTAVDGSATISLTEKWGYIGRSSWSPIHDYLLVNDDAAGYWDATQARLIDMNTQQVIWTLPVPDVFPQWTRDGKHLWYFEPISSASSQENAGSLYRLVTFDLSGQRTEREFFYEGVNIHLDTPVYLTPDGGLLYRQAERHTLVWEDLNTGALTEFPTVTSHLHAIVWSPNEQHALIFTVDEGTHPQGERLGYHLWLLSGKILQDHSDGVASPYADYRYFGEHGFNPLANWSIWTPDSNRALVERPWEGNECEALWIDVEPPPMSNSRLFLPPSLCEDPEPEREKPPLQNALRGQWFPDGKYGFILWRGEVWRYNMETNLPSLHPLDFDFSLGIAPSGNYLALVQACEPFPPDYWLDVRHTANCLLERGAWEGQSIPSAVEGRYYLYGGYADWHESRDWVILKEDVTMRYPDMIFTVVDASSGYYRVVAGTNPWYNTVEWLPPNVPIQD